VVVESQAIFTGFVRRVSLDPSGDQQVMTLECMDWLGILARKDISRPLMRDVRSDILAHRIVDDAELNEQVSNPIFREDTNDDGLPDGYADVGVVTNARTTIEAMEGTYCLQTSAAGAAEGWIYDLPVGLAGTTARASAYVKAYEDAEVGKKVTLFLGDDVASSSSDLTLTAEWQRVVPHNRVMQANPWVALTSAVADGASSFRCGAVHVTEEPGYIPRDFDTGQSRFANVAPRRMKALAALREVATNEGGYLYVDPSPTDEGANLCFEDRCHRWRETASLVSQGTLDETMVAMPYEENIDDIVGEVEFGYMHWEVGAAGTTVFSLYPVPRAVPPNDTLTIDIDYGGIVRAPTKPVANTDYTITDGAGTDETGNVSLTFEDFGGGAQAVFTSSVAYTTFLDTFKIRATPVRPSTDNSQVTYTPSTPPSLASKIRYSFRLLSSRAEAQARAQWVGDRYVTQRSRLPVRLMNKSAALVTQMTERDISDRVTLSNDTATYSAKIDAVPYHIDAIEHHLDFGKTFMETIWHCVPVWNKGTDEQYYWLLGTGELGDAATLTTTTALGP
jgi:hypothetical protein